MTGSLQADVKAALANAQFPQADPRIQAMQEAHASKVKALMASIALLQKQKAQLVEEGREHRRSAAFKKLTDELGKQDAIIDTLREVHGYSAAELRALANKVNSAGPKRAVVESRLELRLQVEELEQKNKGLRDQVKQARQPAEEKAAEANDLARALTGSLAERALAAEKDGAKLREQQQRLQALAEDNQQLAVEMHALKLQLAISPDMDKLGAPASPGGTLNRSLTGSLTRSAGPTARMMDAKLKELERQRDNVEEALVTEREKNAKTAKALQYNKAEVARLEVEREHLIKQQGLKVQEKVIERQKEHDKRLEEWKKEVKSRDETIQALKKDKGELKRAKQKAEEDQKKAEETAKHVKDDRDNNAARAKQLWQELQKYKTDEAHASKALEDQLRGVFETAKADLEAENANIRARVTELEHALAAQAEGKADVEAQLLEAQAAIPHAPTAGTDLAHTMEAQGELEHLRARVGELENELAAQAARREPASPRSPRSPREAPSSPRPFAGGETATDLSVLHLQQELETAHARAGQLQAALDELQNKAPEAQSAERIERLEERNAELEDEARHMEDGWKAAYEECENLRSVLEKARFLIRGLKAQAADPSQRAAVDQFLEQHVTKTLSGAAVVAAAPAAEPG